MMKLIALFAIVGVAAATNPLLTAVDTKSLTTLQNANACNECPTDVCDKWSGVKINGCDGASTAVSTSLSATWTNTAVFKSEPDDNCKNEFTGFTCATTIYLLVSLDTLCENATKPKNVCRGFCKRLIEACESFQTHSDDDGHDHENEADACNVYPETDCENSASAVKVFTAAAVAVVAAVAMLA